MDNSHACMDCLKRQQSDHTCHHPHRFNELATKSEKWNGKPRRNVSMVNIYLQKLLWVYCPGHAGAKGNNWADRLAGKATLTSGLLLGRSKAETWDTSSQGHHTTDHLGEKVLKEEALDNLPWKDERGLSSIRQTLELFQRQHWGNFWKMGWREKWAFSSTWIPSWNELIWKHKSITWLWTPVRQPSTKSVFVKYFVLVKFVITFQDLEYAQHLWLFCLKHKNSYKTHQSLFFFFFYSHQNTVVLKLP